MEVRWAHNPEVAGSTPASASTAMGTHATAENGQAFPVQFRASCRTYWIVMFHARPADM